MDYVTYLPRTVEYEDGTRAILDAEDVLSGRFLLLAPVDLRKHLAERGFTASDGELRKPLGHGWELRIRILEGGFVEAEVASRECRVPVVYEAFAHYRDVYDRLHVYDRIRGEWIVDVLDHYEVVVPRRRVTVVVAVIGPLVSHALSVLSPPEVPR